MGFVNHTSEQEDTKDFFPFVKRQAHIKVCPYTLYFWQTQIIWPYIHFILETPKGILAKSADQDQMPHNVASDLGLHYFASCSATFQQICIHIT